MAPKKASQRTDELLKALMVVSRAVERILETDAVEVARIPLSRSKVQVLRLLGQRGAKNSTQIAHYLGVSKPAVTQVISSLVRSKLVKRESVEGDRRGFAVSLTAKGGDVFQEILKKQRHFVRAALRRSTGRKVDHWIEMLTEISECLSQAGKDVPQFCLQCGAHEDGSCVLIGGKADCRYLAHTARAVKQKRRLESGRTLRRK